LLSVFGGKQLNFSGGGALGAIVLGATAARLWPADARKAVQAHVNAAWALLQPALFGLLGAAVDVRAVAPASLGSGLAVIVSALAVRIVVTRLALLRSGLTDLEARLVCVAWLPKATVQAAVGGTALDLMVERGYGEEAEERGRLVLMLSVLVILLTAPVGALGISLLGPRWLPHDGVGGEEKQHATITSMEPIAAPNSEPPRGADAEEAGPPAAAIDSGRA
jgi:NhaP-type Na+/H+ or K+/H+ antiporter